MAVRYTMTAFTNNSESQLYVYESADAMQFRPLRGPTYTPPGGLLRDPSVIRHADGRYHLVYTTGWTGNTIGFAASVDRVNWTFRYNHTVQLPGVQNTWAPEWFVDGDGSVHIVVSLFQGSGFRPHLLSSTDPGLNAWTAPAPLAGLEPNYIDTFVVRIPAPGGQQYHVFTKNETTKLVEHATADRLAGPYTFVDTGNWAGWGAPREGQALVQLDDGVWRVFLDAYDDRKYFYSDSRDGFRTWSTPRELPELSGFVRHFTVLKETL